MWAFMEDTSLEQRNKMQKRLIDRYEHKQILFDEADPVIEKYVYKLRQRLIESKQ